MTRYVKLGAELMIMAAVAATVFKVSPIFGAALVVGFVTYEATAWYERRELMKQLLEARNLLLQLDNQEDTSSSGNLGNC